MRLMRLDLPLPVPPMTPMVWPRLAVKLMSERLGCACALVGQAHMVEADGVAGLFRRNIAGELGRELHAGFVSRTACTRPAQARALLT